MGSPTQAIANDSNPFKSLDRLRLDQNFSVGVRKVITTIPVKSPSRDAFIRVHPELALETYLLEMKDDRESYLVDSPLWSSLSKELVPKILVPAITAQGLLFLWPLRLLGRDGKRDSWINSGLEALEMARKSWIRVIPEMTLGAYEIYEAEADLGDPQFPDMPFAEMLRIAFGEDRYIRSLDHKVLRKLRGEVRGEVK